MSIPLIIWGASGHARVVADTALAMGRFDLVGLVDDDPAKVGASLMGMPVLGSLEMVPRWKNAQLFLAIGDNAARLRKADSLASIALTFATLIHPQAVLARDVNVGVGTLVAAGAVVQPGTQLGRHVIINTLAGVDHDCVLADGVHIAPGAHLAGNVRVGRRTMIGLGAAIREGITLGQDARIGAGAVVIRDVPDQITVVGNPARILTP